METQQIIYLVATFFITSLLWFVYTQSLKNKYAILKNTYDNLSQNVDKEVIVKADQSVDDLQQTISDLKVRIAEAKQESFMEGYDKARKEFSVKVFPYKKEHKQGDDGWLINDIYHSVSLGYQYQLFVNGLPVLQPAIIIEEILEENKREVSYDKIKIAFDTIESNLKPLIANSNGLLKYLPNSKSK